MAAIQTDMRGLRGRFWASSTGPWGSVLCSGRFGICRARLRARSSTLESTSSRWVFCRNRARSFSRVQPGLDCVGDGDLLDAVEDVASYTTLGDCGQLQRMLD